MLASLCTYPDHRPIGHPGLIRRANRVAARASNPHDQLEIRLQVTGSAAALRRRYNSDPGAGNWRHHHAIFVDRRGVVEAAALSASGAIGFGVRGQSRQESEHQLGGPWARGRLEPAEPEFRSDIGIEYGERHRYQRK